MSLLTPSQDTRDKIYLYIIVNSVVNAVSTTVGESFDENCKLVS